LYPVPLNVKTRYAIYVIACLVDKTVQYRANAKECGEQEKLCFPKRSTAGFQFSAFSIMLTAAMQGKTSVTKQAFGQTSDGTAVDLYTLADGKVEARIRIMGESSFRCARRIARENSTTWCWVMTRSRATARILLILAPSLAVYANRIAHGSFQLDGKTYSVPKNDGRTMRFTAESAASTKPRGLPRNKDGIELTYVSKEEIKASRGTLTTTVRYTLDGGALRIEYSATTDKDTVLNLTNHS